MGTSAALVVSVYSREEEVGRGRVPYDFGVSGDGKQEGGGLRQACYCFLWWWLLLLNWERVISSFAELGTVREKLVEVVGGEWRKPCSHLKVKCAPVDSGVSYLCLVVIWNHF